MKNKKKKDKIKWIDDGRTIADMNVEGFRWYRPAKRPRQAPKEKEPLKLTRKEQFAIIKAAYLTLLPYLCGLIVVLILLFLILWLWLQ